MDQLYRKCNHGESFIDKITTVFKKLSANVKDRYTITEEVKYLDDKKVSKELFNHSFNHLLNNVEKVFKNVKYGSDEFDQVNKIKRNVAEFSAYKSAQFTSKLKGQDKEGADAILNTYERQLVAEGNLAARSSRAAKQWFQFENDADVFPHLEYLPSRSSDRRNEHEKLYGIIRPINDRFWSTHLPPNGFNCKCRVRQTKEKPTSISAIELPKSLKGISGNTGKTGTVFSNSHPFFSNVSKKGKEGIGKELLKHERNYILNRASKFVGKSYKKEGVKIDITKTGLKEILNQNHDLYREKNYLLFDIENLIKQSVFKKEVTVNDILGLNKVSYYEVNIDKKNSYLVVKHYDNGINSLYSIVDKLKK